MTENIAYQQAMMKLDQAQRYQMQGRFADAISLYQQSIAWHATAEAHTYLGWTYGMMRRYDEAIEQCEKAIIVDPTFGNPYNDIGSYLIEVGKWDEAQPWFEQALDAGRYDVPHYPLLNIGRVHEHFGRFRSALEYYNKALRIDPIYRPALMAKYNLLSRMN